MTENTTSPPGPLSAMQRGGADVTDRYTDTIRRIFGADLVKEITGDGFQALEFKDGARVLITTDGDWMRAGVSLICLNDDGAERMRHLLALDMESPKPKRRRK